MSCFLGEGVCLDEQASQAACIYFIFLKFFLFLTDMN